MCNGDPCFMGIVPGKTSWNHIPALLVFQSHLPSSVHWLVAVSPLTIECYNSSSLLFLIENLMMQPTKQAPWTQWFQPSVLLPAITAGVVSSVILIVVAISFGAMIFSGELVPYVSRAIGFILFGVTVICGITALTSTFPSMVANPQDNPAAILAAIGSIVSAGAVTTLDQAAATLFVIIMITAILTGITCFLLGKFKLGNLVRYIPYPVVGGFLAGVGYLLITGSFSVLTDENLDLAQAQHFLQPEMLIRWLPGIIFGVVVLLIVRRISHFLVIPSMIVGGIVLFYVLLLLTGTSIEQALQQKLLLGSFPAGGLWQPPDLVMLSQVNWSVVVAELPRIITVVMISIFSLLLNLTGLEVTAKRDFDLNHELKSAGIANIVAGIGGSAPGYPALSLSALGFKMGAESRLVGLTVTLLSGVTLLFGASVLTYLPKYVLGGLLFFLGLAFLVEWLYDGWFQFRKIDYLIVLCITIVMGAIGVLEGVAVGMMFSILTFIIDYSHINIVKHEFSGTYYRSKVDRPLLQDQLLAEKGTWIRIMELQGFIFFGVSNQLLDRVRSCLDESDPLRYLVLDFRHVTGIDASAVVSFVKLKQIARSNRFSLVFTRLSEAVQKPLEREVFTKQDSDLWQIFPNLDYGIEWCEEQVLKTFAELGGLFKRRSRSMGISDYFPPTEKPKSFWTQIIQEQLRPLMPDISTDVLERISSYLERTEFETNTPVIEQDKVVKGLYFIESGQVTVLHKQGDSVSERLRVMGAGTVIGEISFYTGLPATASVVTTQPSVLHLMPTTTLRKIEADDPKAAVILHKFLAHILSEHLVRSTAVVQNLSK
jgi:SulP family sulfate permease